MKEIRTLLLVGMIFFCQFGFSKTYHGTITYNSYKGLVMAGYQGWHDTPDDGANRGWYHYRGKNGFKPGSTNVDFWPDVSEYPKVYRTEFTFDDGMPAYVQSAHDYSTVETHFRWMKEYGLDGVFMQRFVAEIKNPSGKSHFNHVLASAMAAANKYSRAICVMYDLSGMQPGDEDTLLTDVQKIAKEYSLFRHADNPSYLYHNGKPLIVVWGIGFNDHRKYGLTEGFKIVESLKSLGFSVMLGVPTYWRELKQDTEPDPRLHELIRKCDIVMPWFVGRYDEKSYPKFRSLIKHDIQWAAQNHVDYAPLCFPGFSWVNMNYPRVTKQIPRNHGKFFKKQLDYCLSVGAEMIYIAMFDEIDEGTAIFKCAKRVPTATPGSTFVPIDSDINSDHYLVLAGNAAKTLKNKVR